MKATSNPKLYRELSAPFLSCEEANKSLEAFGSELEALRIKHRIADVVVVVSVNAKTDGDDEGMLSATISFGERNKRALMLANALGKEQKAFEQDIAVLVRSK